MSTPKIPTTPHPCISLWPNGDPAAVEWPIRCNAKVNARDDQNSTTLHFGLINDNIDTDQLLIQNGANVNVSNNRKLTPLHPAAISGKIDVVKLLVNKAQI